MDFWDACSRFCQSTRDNNEDCIILARHAATIVDALVVATDGRKDQLDATFDADLAMLKK